MIREPNKMKNKKENAPKKWLTCFAAAVLVLVNSRQTGRRFLADEDGLRRLNGFNTGFRSVCRRFDHQADDDGEKKKWKSNLIFVKKCPVGWIQYGQVLDSLCDVA